MSGRGSQAGWARRVVSGVALFVAAACAAPAVGQPTDEFVLAFKVTEDRRAFVETTAPLAGWLTASTGIPTRVFTVQDDRAQITALATGQAHAAYMSGGVAWIGWQEFGLEAIAAEVLAEGGATSYTAGLWVLDDGGMETVADLRGQRSCHTGELTGTGMFVPIGYLVRHGYVDTAGIDMTSIASLQQLRERFFGASQIGGGYEGAFRCLSTGQGDVATGRRTAWDDFCGGSDPARWCRPRDAYRFLPAPGGPDPTLPGGGLADVPSHPVMVSPHLSERDRATLLDALLALNDDADGRRILAEILGVAALVPVTSEEHLGPYGDILQHVPGVRVHLLGGNG